MKEVNKQRLENYPIHESMRGYFGHSLYEEMANNPNIVLITADLGYKLFDPHFADFPDRCFNVGASEQAAMGIACGMALEGKIPFVYSITPFLLYRPFETIRTYIDHEEIPVKLVGSGRDFDYDRDGFSHHSPDAQKVLGDLPHICTFWPETKEEVARLIQEIVSNGKPSFISLKR